ncbi:MAG: DAK2 domain-containing protein [Streptosporangiales bacterium]|nr:DAK2 domain-containing protein [Streptosporangiales bacterium]
MVETRSAFDGGDAKEGRPVARLEILDAAAVRRWCDVAARELGRSHRAIDTLNVFPVPDGDTGTNLHLTMRAALEAAEELPAEAAPAEVWAALAKGALLGARGNSGVMMSQWLRGLADILSDGRGSDGPRLREALAYAGALARAAVAHPVEGTLLSAADAARDGAASAGDGLAEVAAAAAVAARAARDASPERLAVLADNGVVDAGAAGLCVVLDALAAVASDTYPEPFSVPAAPRRHAPPPISSPFQYEVMYLLDADDAAVQALRDTLDHLGDSLVVVGGAGLWNVHVHVSDAGAAIEAGLAAGRPYRIRVTHLDTAVPADPPSRGVLAVVVGEALGSLHAEAGARVLRRAPGTVPSVTALLEAVRETGGEVVLLPNDDAVLPVAEAAAERAREEGIRVSVVPARASVQGLAALAVHDPLRRFDDDVVAMTSAAGATRFGELTVAVERAMTSAGLCEPGDVLGMIEGDVSVIGADPHRVAAAVLDAMLAAGGELVTFVTGADGGAELAEALCARMAERAPGVETVVYPGGQPHHALLIGVE